MLEAAPIHGLVKTCRAIVGVHVTSWRTVAYAYGDQLLRSQPKVALNIIWVDPDGVVFGQPFTE